MTREQKKREAEREFDEIYAPIKAKFGKSEEEILRALKYSSDEPCVLCGGVVNLVALFIPKNESFARRLGQPEGKHRLITYGLCEPCFRLPDRDDKVEAEMIKRFQVV